MPSLVDRLGLLRRLSPRTRLAALDAGLRVGDAAERRALVEAIGALAEKSRGDDAVRMLIEHAGTEADAGVRRRVFELVRGLDRGRVEEILTGLLDQGDPAASAIAARAIGLLPCHTLAGRLARMLGGADEACAAAAERSLQALAAWLIDAKVAGRAVSPGHVGGAILAAVERVHEHRQVAVVTDLIRLVHAGMRFEQPARIGDAWPRPAAATWLNDSDHPALLTVRRSLRSSGDPASRAAAWVWLKHPVIASACAERLVAAAPPRDLEWVLARTHLASNPARAKELTRLVGDRGTVAATVVPDSATVEAMPAKSRTGFAAWVGLLPIPTKLKDAALGGLLSDREPMVRHTTLRAAAALEARPACMLDLCFDADPRVARSAALAVACQQDRGMVRDAMRERTLTALARSPHPAVARVAAGATGADSLATPASALARVRLRRALADEPVAVVTRLIAAITSGDTRSAMNSVGILRRLRLVRDVLPTINQVLHGALSADAATENRLASLLASALGDLEDAESGAVLDRCLQATDARLRANATDAITRRLRRASRVPGPQTQRLLLGQCADESHRPRASAARALLTASSPHVPRSTSSRNPAEQTLLAMLEDQRPMHRVAGLWLAERAATRVAPLPEIVDAVAAIARAASGEDERARARRAAQRLIVEIRTGWSQRAPAMTAGAEEVAA